MVLILTVANLCAMLCGSKGGRLVKGERGGRKGSGRFWGVGDGMLERGRLVRGIKIIGCITIPVSLFQQKTETCLNYKT